MQQVTKEIANKECPKCHVVGGLFIAISSYSITCRNCKGAFIDPFEIGPWDSHIAVVDLLDGEEIVRRVPNVVEETVDDQEKMEFYKFLYKKEGKALS
jgi:hypothetical protein